MTSAIAFTLSAVMMAVTAADERSDSPVTYSQTACAVPVTGSRPLG